MESPVVNSKSSQPAAATWNARDLPAMPRALVELIDAATSRLAVEKIILFGSRARGDNTDRSDYDLCFFLQSPKFWPEFVTTIADSVTTLCEFDLLKFDELDDNLQREILNHGVVLYDATKNRDIGRKS